MWQDLTPQRDSTRPHTAAVVAMSNAQRCGLYPKLKSKSAILHLLCNFGEFFSSFPGFRTNSSYRFNPVNLKNKFVQRYRLSREAQDALDWNINIYITECNIQQLLHYNKYLLKIRVYSLHLSCSNQYVWCEKGSRSQIWGFPRLYRAF